MYKRNKMGRTSMQCNESTVGESIEQKVERMRNTKEPITDGAESIFQERSDGVNPACDIRTDRMEIALEASSKINDTQMARRKKLLDEKNAKENPQSEGGTETVDSSGTSK